MKKMMILITLAAFINVFGAETVSINKELLEIKARMPQLQKVGVIFNPDTVNLQGGASSVKAVALPVTNGPTLLKQSRVMIRNVDAIYLMEGRFVTAEKMARMLAKNASKAGVRIFTNDPALADIPGIQVLGSEMATETAAP